MNKREIRERLRALRRGLSSREKEDAARAVFERIAEYEAYKRARVVMAYIAVRGELSLAPVIADILAGGKTLLLPRCEAPGIMTARIVRAVEDLTPGVFGLLEPKMECRIADPAQIGLILVPGVAFDREGHRIGQGGGYYDRFLGKSGAHRAGVCHDFALLESVPFEAHDLLMDDVITPGGMYSAGKRCDRRT